jgi:hypothetical protein
MSESIPPAGDNRSVAESSAAGSAGHGTPTGVETARSKAKLARVITRAIQFLGMTAIGVLIGIPIQCGVQKTGIMGPSVAALIEDQSRSLQQLQDSLNALREAAGSSPEVSGKLDGLQKTLDAQKALTERSAAELRGLYAELERVKTDALAAQGFAGGANLWLGPGESVAVHSPGNTFTYVRPYSGRTILASVNGETKPLTVGESVDVPTALGIYRVVFKQSEARADGRIGFDIVKPG